MGYYIKMTRLTIKIPVENKDKILELKDQFIKNGCGYVSDYTDFTFEELMEDIGYKVILKDNKYEVEFIDYKYINTDAVWRILAPYVEDGYIEFIGEENDYFRYVIKDGKMTEHREVVNIMSKEVLNWFL